MNALNLKNIFIAPLLLMAIALLCTQSLNAGVDKPLSPRNVLVLHSSYDSFPWTASIQKGIEQRFASHTQPIEFWTEYLDTKRNKNPQYFEKLHALLSIKYKDTALDLIITVDNDAYNFIMHDHGVLFPNVPVVFSGFNGYKPVYFTDQPLVTGVVEDSSFEETMDLALSLHPNTQKIVFLIPDAWPSRLAWVEDLPDKYQGRVEVINSYANSFKSIDTELEALGPNIVVIPLNSFMISSGQYLPFPELISHLASKNYPVYGLWDVALGHGIIGGKLVSGELQGSEAARLGLKILEGKPVSEVAIIEKSPNNFMFDWPQLRRFNLASNDLPVGAIVINRPVNFYEKYKVITWIVISIILFLTFLIALLSFNIRQRKRVERELGYQASHDSLTGLVNRREFELRAERLLSLKRQNFNRHVLCYMDLDQFKLVNDNYGHNAGDELLRQLGFELQKMVRRGDTLARLGGDEFGILMEYCSIEDAYRIAGSFLKMIQEYQFFWEGHALKVSVSIGLVPITSESSNLTQLLKDADTACYIAKDNGRNRIQIYDSDDLKIAQTHGEMKWVEVIQHALKYDLLCLYAQPITSLKDREGQHLEILLRMESESGNVIAPDNFLPAAERYNLITTIDRWVINKTFYTLANSPDFLTQLKVCAINLSGPSVSSSTMLEYIIEQLNSFKIPGHKICFEITETAAISNLGKASEFMKSLKALGCRFSLDDFGSGLSSFAYLKNLPVDYLKIDGMFVKDIVDDPIDFAMVKSINEIGQVMGMLTIAEFVENQKIKDALQQIGVDYAQGYSIERPMPLAQIISRSVENTLSNID